MNLYVVILSVIVIVLLAVSLSQLRNVKTKADYLVAGRSLLRPRGGGASAGGDLPAAAASFLPFAPTPGVPRGRRAASREVPP